MRVGVIANDSRSQRFLFKKKKKSFYSSKNTVSAVKTVGFNGGE